LEQQQSSTKKSINSSTKDVMAPRVLFILTSHNKIDAADKPSGWYLPEFAHPYYILKNAGASITVVSPKGGEAPLDPLSVELFKEDKESSQFLKEEESLWKNTEKLSNYVGKADQFDAVVVPGGHGRK
jgi:putative intracellular protease/amidase